MTAPRACARHGRGQQLQRLSLSVPSRDSAMLALMIFTNFLGSSFSLLRAARARPAPIAPTAIIIATPLEMEPRMPITPVNAFFLFRITD